MKNLGLPQEGGLYTINGEDWTYYSGSDTLEFFQPKWLAYKYVPFFSNILKDKRVTINSIANRVMENCKEVNAAIFDNDIRLLIPSQMDWYDGPEAVEIPVETMMRICEAFFKCGKT
jgi:hypothetical protein